MQNNKVKIQLKFASTEDTSTVQELYDLFEEERLENLKFEIERTEPEPNSKGLSDLHPFINIIIENWSIIISNFELIEKTLKPVFVIYKYFQKNRQETRNQIKEKSIEMIIEKNDKKASVKITNCDDNETEKVLQMLKHFIYAS